MKSYFAGCKIKLVQNNRFQWRQIQIKYYHLNFADRAIISRHAHTNRCLFYSTVYIIVSTDTNAFKNRIANGDISLNCILYSTVIAEYRLESISKCDKICYHFVLSNHSFSFPHFFLSPRNRNIFSEFFDCKVHSDKEKMSVFYCLSFFTVDQIK